MTKVTEQDIQSAAAAAEALAVYLTKRILDSIERIHTNPTFPGEKVELNCVLGVYAATSDGVTGIKFSTWTMTGEEELERVKWLMRDFLEELDKQPEEQRGTTRIWEQEV